MTINDPMRHESAHLLLQEGLAMFQRGQLDQAENLYQKALQLIPGHPEALHLLGLLASEKGDHTKATQLIELSLRTHPYNAVAWNNLGNLHRKLGRWQKALLCYERAIDIKPEYHLAVANKGAAAQALDNPLLAARCYRSAMVEPRLREGCRCTALQMEMALSDWSNAAEIEHLLPTAISAGQVSTPPFSVLAMLDKPELHLMVASAFGQISHPPISQSAPWPDRAGANKIRIGYFSADFHDHATAWLMADLIERHDREHFEWHAFSFGPDRDDEMRRRLIDAFDKFHNVRPLSDDQAVGLARSVGIDIAVDLKGYTAGMRTGIFARRAAPIQVNYLGYPGSMGVSYMDYILADSTVIPNGSFSLYSEKVVRLSQCYFPNDSRQSPTQPALCRKSFGLPDGAFVFCCINNNYKITPEVFTLWCQILKRVDNSVLWLYVSYPQAAENLRRAAQQAGIDPVRLIFATKVPHEEHLLRYACADLFLDTFPYNAHTTASDALWKALPVLTRRGRSFASRVASSMLVACELTELITDSPGEYVARAIQLGNEPSALNRYRQHLRANRHRLAFFDTVALARNMEKAFKSMHQRWRDGLPPAHFDA